eukprot:6183071-Pleurochrysis_carterae.AAC.4
MVAHTRTQTCTRARTNRHTRGYEHQGERRDPLTYNRPIRERTCARAHAYCTLARAHFSHARRAARFRDTHACSRRVRRKQASMCAHVQVGTKPREPAQMSASLRKAAYDIVGIHASVCAQISSALHCAHVSDGKYSFMVVCPEAAVQGGGAERASS